MAVLATVWTLAGLSWEPEIRGALTVALGAAILCGSVWLLLATNTGHRLGSLLALAGFFGWMAIMGAIWWVYGIGYKGTDPVWVAHEINTADISQASTGPASDLAKVTKANAPDLVDRYCPDLVADFTAVIEERTSTGDVAIPLESNGRAGFCTEEVGELLATNTVLISNTQTARNDVLADDDPRKLTDAELADDISTRIADDQRRKQGLTLSSLASFAPEIIEAAQADGLLEFGDWNLLSSAEAGEAQAVADVALRGEDGPFAADDVYVLLDAYQQGGKRGRSGDSHWDAVTYKVRTTLQFWNPTNYSVIQVQKALDKDAVPGEPPPFAEADPNAPVVSVILIRDLGNKRVPPALISIGSLLVFLVLCWMLHLRDKQVAERLAQK